MVHRMKFVDKDTLKPVKTKIPCLENLEWSIEGMILLWDILKTKHGFESFNPRFANQDPQENLFGRIRSQGDRNNNPTLSQFSDIFRSLIIQDLSSGKIVGANCIPDQAAFLQVCMEFFQQKPEDTEASPFNLPPGVAVPFPEHVTNLSSLTQFIQISKNKLRFLKDCSTCSKCLMSTDGVFINDFFVKVFAQFKLLILPILPKIFNANKITVVCTQLIKDKCNFVSCQTHKDIIIHWLVNSFLRLNLQQITIFLNKIIKGKILMTDVSCENQFVQAAWDKYQKSIPKAKRSMPSDSQTT